MEERISYKFVSNKYLLVIIICSFFLFIGKWIFSYYFFDDPLHIKIIFDTRGDGFMYYPYIKALSEFNFNNSFDQNITDLKNIAIPIYSVIFHAILISLFGNSTFLILEFLCIFSFLLIFYKIFNKFGFSQILSMVLALSILFIPSFINIFKLDFLPYIKNLNLIFNLRFPNSMITNLYFYFFILFLICLEDNKIFKYKNFIILGVILSLSLSSYHYYFVIEVITFSLFLLLKFDFKLSLIFKNKYKFYLVSLVVFFILSFPFLFNMYLTEPDYNERLGIFQLTLERKRILLLHLLAKITQIKFILFFLIVTLLNYLINKKKISSYNLNNIFFLLLIGSILAPFIFIFFSPKTLFVYPFSNTIFIMAFFCIFFQILNLSRYYFIKLFGQKNLNKYSFLFIIFIVFSYNLKTFYDYKRKFLNEDYVNYRSNFNFITNKLKNIQSENKDLSLLTFNTKLMTWSIMNDIKYLKPLSGQLVSKTHNMVENDLISAFKFLGLKEEDFLEFFENKKIGWRYLNRQTQSFFWMRYTANSLKTHNNSKEFEPEVLKYILNTSPLQVQSLAIPINEFDRLIKKFKINEKNNGIEPTVISPIVRGRKGEYKIVENKILNNMKIDKNKYCLISNDKNLKIYISKIFENFCD